jgi:hypothetical protein
VKQKSCDNDEDKNTIVGLQRRACNSSNSPPQRGDKGECSRYNSAYRSVSFDYLRMINLYVKMEEKIHVHIVVYITIIFQNLGKY